MDAARKWRMAILGCCHATTTCRAAPETEETKIAALSGVAEAKVHIVWDPAWTPAMMSAEGRQVLGLE